jgi:predicted transcriptional regulator
VTVSRQQIRAARALLEWDQPRLAKEAGVSQSSIARIEMGEVEPRPYTMDAIQRALERAGVEFIGEKRAAGGGVRLRRPRLP